MSAVFPQLRTTDLDASIDFYVLDKYQTISVGATISATAKVV